MAWILMGLPHMAEAAIEVSRGPDGSDRVSGELINVDWQADDTVILSWKKSGKSFLELGPKRIFGSTRRGETGSWKRKNRSIKNNSSHVIVTELWIEPNKGVEIECHYTLHENKPYLKVELAGKNVRQEEVELYTLFNARYPEDAVSPERAVAFATRKQWNDAEFLSEEGAGPLLFDLKKNFFNHRWGTVELSWLPNQEDFDRTVRPEIWTATSSIPWTERQGVFLPIVCPILKSNDRDAGGPVVFFENCISLGLLVDGAGIGVTKTFFLNARSEQKFVDNGLDLGDGFGKRPYAFYLGYAEKPSWESILYDYYFNEFPKLLAETPASKVNLPEGSYGTFGGPFMDAQWTDYWASWFAFANVSLVDNWMQHANRDMLLKYGCPGLEIGAARGLKVGMSDNAMVVPSNNPQYWNAQDYYFNFEDSYIWSKDRKAPLKSWEGYAVNQSPRFSFGQHQIEDIRATFEHYDLASYFLDYFGSGRGEDWGHRHEHLPFFPDAVALNQFTREVATFLHHRDAIFIANVPDASTSCLTWADMVYGDIGHFAFLYKMIAGYRPFYATGIVVKGTRDEQTYNLIKECLAGGFSSSLSIGGHSGWYIVGEVDAEKESALRIWARNNPVLVYSCAAALVAGDLQYTNFFHHRNGLVFASLRSSRDEEEARDRMTEKRMIQIPLKRTRLQAAAAYSVFEWDMAEGFTMLHPSIQGRDLERGIDVSIPAGKVRLLVIVPANSGLLAPFLAAAPAQGVYVRYATATMENAEWVSNSTSDEFHLTLENPEGIRSFNAVHWGNKGRPNLKLVGGNEVEIVWDKDGLELECFHGLKPLQIVLSWQK